jgi:hypothetical protein
LGDVGEQATRTRTSLTLTVFSENVFSVYQSGEVFPLVARGLLTIIALCSSGFASSFPSANYTFLSEKALRVSRRLFYRLSREEFSAARSEPIVFLFGA